MQQLAPFFFFIEELFDLVPDQEEISLQG